MTLHPMCVRNLGLHMASSQTGLLSVGREMGVHQMVIVRLADSASQLILSTSTYLVKDSKLPGLNQSRVHWSS